MPIEIYPNRLEARPIETHQVETRMTLAAFLDQTMKGGYRAGESLPLSAWVNDERVPPEHWGSFVFLPKDQVRLHIQPRGTDPFSITLALFGAVSAVFSALMPKLPGTPSTPGQGDQLNQSSVRGNKVKMGDPVAEIFGRRKTYPSYLVPPRRYYVNSNEQWLELGLCVGVGKFQVLANDIRLGDTSVIALGADASYQIFEPGQSVAGYTPFDWWHTCAEVGANSNGQAGLELAPSITVTPNPASGTFNFNGYQITIPDGTAFPSDWSVGLVLRVVAPYTYTVTDGGPGLRDEITGPLAMLAPVVGDQIEVAGANPGFYEIASYTATPSPKMTLDYANGSPATALELGTAQSAIGPVGLRFRILAISGNSITVERLGSSGSSDSSFPGFDPLTSSDATVSVDASAGEGGWRGPFLAVPPGELTDTIEWNMFYPNGICVLDNKGRFYTLVITYEVQYRDSAIGGAWTSQTFTNSGATLNQVGYTVRLSLPYKMRPEVRMRKIGPITEDLAYHHTTQWQDLRALLVAPTSYEGCTTIGLKFRSSDRISAQVESLVSTVVTRILPRRVGGAWLPEGPTRALVDAAAYIPRSLGYPESRFNLEEFDELNPIWASRADHFDEEYAKESTAQQVLNDILGAGFAELTLDRGQITPVRDSPRTVFEQMYTPQNMVGFLKRTPRLVANPEEFDGVDVTFFDSSSWAESTVPCRLPGDLGLKVEKISLPGITDRNKAYQLGMRRRRVQRYRPDTFEWQTEADAFVSRYLSYCAVSDDVSGYPQSALMLSYSVSGGTWQVESSEPLDWSAGGDHGVLFRRPDGSATPPVLATRINDFLFSVPAADFTPDTSWVKDPPHILFGPMTRVCYPVLITSVDPNGLSSATVQAVGYDGRVYLDDDSPAP